MFAGALRVIQADATKVDWDALCADPGPGAEGTRFKVVANLPFNVGTTLTMQLVRRPALFSSITVMLQREVVDRICAAPGSRTYGALSVELQARARPTFITLVPPDRFHPPPKVDSSVVRLDLLEEPAVGPAGPEVFDAVVRAGFGQRRKTLANALGARYGRDRARMVVEAAGLSPRVRAEALDLDAFRRLASLLAAPADPGDQRHDQR